jgi:hypothetical protein
MGEKRQAVKLSACVWSDEMDIQPRDECPLVRRANGVQVSYSCTRDSPYDFAPLSSESNHERRDDGDSGRRPRGPSGAAGRHTDGYSGRAGPGSRWPARF